MYLREVIKQNFNLLTQSERKLAAVLLSDYPVSGLASIQDLADRAEVSAPSVSRFVTKIGLSGYQEMQRSLVEEIRAGNRSPVDLHETGSPIEGGYLSEFLARATAQMQAVGEVITEGQFTQICKFLSDPKRNIYSVGGRVSDTIAMNFSFHMRQARQGAFHIPRDPENWPEYILRMKPNDVLFVVDFRRYQPSLAWLAQQAAQKRKACVILMTDKWLSPATRYATEVLPVPIDTGTIWDSYSAALTVVEALVTHVGEANWEETRKRIEAWDQMRRNEIEDKQ